MKKNKLENSSCATRSMLEFGVLGSQKKITKKIESATLNKYMQKEQEVLSNMMQVALLRTHTNLEM